MRDDQIVNPIEPIEPIEQQPQEPEDSFAAPEVMPVSKGKEALASFLSGNFLTKAEVRRVYPYMIAIFALMIIYITNVFNMQQLYRRHSKLQQQVKELRARSATISAIKMNATRQSEITRVLSERGIELTESLTPPKVIESNE